MEQPGSDEANVMAMIGDWREETLDLEALLHSSSSSQGKSNNAAIPSQAPSSQPQDHDQSRLQSVTTTGESLLPSYPQKIGVPTFSSSANRPSVLDLSTTIKYQERPRTLGNMNGHCHPQQRAVSPHQSPHSPHHSPYMQNNQQVFSYNNVQEQQVHSPVSPHQRTLHSPVSPHNPSIEQGPMSPHMPGSSSPHHIVQQQGPLSPHSPYPMTNRGAMSPVSPHHGMVSPGSVSPHHSMTNPPGSISPHHPGMHGAGGMSPHHISHSGSVSPIPRQHSPAPGASSVFGRYAGSPVSMHSGNSSDTDSYYSACQLAEMRKRGISIDKNSELYKAKRERNNVAVRKSREKKKVREQETERRVKELSDENASLQSKLDIALKEMTLLKNLYKSIGVQLPQEARTKLENELSKFK